MQNFLEVTDLLKIWENKKVQISFSMKRGEAIALVGPSGCGKSTVLKMLTGLLPSDGGTIFLDGHDITNCPASKRHIGMVFQNYALFPHLSVAENIEFPLKSAAVKKTERHRLLTEWLARFDIADLKNRSVNELSGGEKQRVALARTLIIQPDIVLFDEPLSALDTNLRARLQQELLNNRKDLGYTAIYVTHDSKEAEFLADRILRMD